MLYGFPLAVYSIELMLTVQLHEGRKEWLGQALVLVATLFILCALSILCAVMLTL